MPRIRMESVALDQGEEPTAGDHRGRVATAALDLPQQRRPLLRPAGEQSLTGGDAVVREHLGDVYRALELLDKARDQYRLALARDASNARLKAKLAQTTP